MRRGDQILLEPFDFRRWSFAHGIECLFGAIDGTELIRIPLVHLRVVSEQPENAGVRKHSDTLFECGRTFLGHLAFAELVEQPHENWFILTVDRAERHAGEVEFVPRRASECPVVASRLCYGRELEEIPHGKDLDATERAVVVADGAAHEIDERKDAAGEHGHFIDDQGGGAPDAPACALP